MRRSKIRPSINLAASRRSTPANAVKVDNKVKKTPPKETTPNKTPIPTIACTSDSPKNAAGVSSAKPVVAARPASPKTARPESARPESPLKNVLEPSRPESVSRKTTQVPVEAKSTEAVIDTNVAVTEKVHSPDTSNQVTESTATPSLAKDNPQRRRRISAKPNLGQHRMRLPLPSVPRREKKSETVQKYTAIDTSDSGAVLNGDAAKPSEPPPVRRVVESIKNTEVIQNATMAGTGTTQTNIREISTSTQSRPQPSKPTIHPKTVQQPSRADRLVEKRAMLTPTMQDKRIRDLKALEAETPAKRRKRYIRKTAPPDRSKMTMSDLIYYNPKANPMKSVITSKDKVRPINDNNNSLKEKSSATNEADKEAEEEEDSGSNQMAPQVRIDADGKIVLDKESLTIEASPLRTFVMEDAEVVHEDCSNVTYASFRKRIHTTAWTKMETERFFMALSMVGTDFTMMNVLFPKRTRHQIKNKFKREERSNRLRIDKAIREKKPLDKSLFENGDSDVENVAAGDKKTKGKKQGPKQKVMSSEEAQLEYEEEEFNESLLDNDSVNGDDGSDIEVTNILARPTRSGRMPKVRVNYDNSTNIDDLCVDGGIVRQIGSSPMVNGALQRTLGSMTPGSSVIPPGGTPSRVSPAQGTPTTPMQTVYVVTPLQGGKQFMIRQHTIPQPSPEAIQLALEQTTNTPSQFPAYNASAAPQSPVIQLQTTPQQQLSQTPLNTSTMQLRMPSPQNPMTSPTGSHTVLTQRVGNTQFIVVSPATGGTGSPGLLTGGTGSPGQLNVRHSLPSTSVQNTTGPVHLNAAMLQNQTNTPPSESGVIRCQNVNDSQQRTFIRIQPGDVRISPSSNTAMPIRGLPQQKRVPRQNTKNDHKRKSNRNFEVPLDEPFIPPSMKSKPSQREGANSIITQQKVIVQSLPQSLESGYTDDSMPNHPEVLLLDDVTLAAQTEVVSDVAMEVEAECTN